MKCSCGCRSEADRDEADAEADGEGEGEGEADVDASQEIVAGNDRQNEKADPSSSLPSSPRKAFFAVAYYSVEQAMYSDCLGPVLSPGPRQNRGSIFRVVKFGSREAALAAAFYDAGAHGYSTVFSCAVRDHVAFGECVGMESGCARVKELRNLKKKKKGNGDEKAAGKVKVLY